MRPLPDIDMAQVTRLTRDGRLDDAMALLRGVAVEPGTFARPLHADASGVVHPARDLAAIVDRLSPTAAMCARTAAPAHPPTLVHAPPPRGATIRAKPDRLLKPRVRIGAGLGRARAQPAPLPAGARFEQRNHANVAGSRSYRLYLPASHDATPLPLVVMLHGCTQTPEDFALGTRMNELAEEQGFLVAYPAQAQSANASRCWNWFNSADQQREQGEPALIAGITREVMRNHAVAADRVYVAGLSAGAAMAAILGAAYPDLYAAVGVHSGLARGAASDMPSAFAAMRNGAAPGTAPAISPHGVPTIVFHGDEDTTVHPVNGDYVAAQARGAANLQRSTSRGMSAGGIAYTRTLECAADGRAMLEQWVLHGAGHAWSGGSTNGSHVEARGPDASREMLRFFRGHTAAHDPVWHANAV